MILAIVGVVLAVAVGVLVWWFRREQHRRLPAVSTPPIVFVPHSERAGHWLAPHPGGAAQPAGMSAGKPQLVDAEEEVPVRRVAGLADTAPPSRRPARTAPAPGGVAVPPAARTMAPPPMGPAFAPVSSTPQPLDHQAAPDALAVPEARPGRAAPPMPLVAPTPTIAGSTLRMLPGRLEYVDGTGAAADIRFVHCSAGPEQRVTLGRGDGPSYEHVQLQSPTVSRMHAALCYRDGRWTIANLSETNPLRLNGLELAADSTAVPLSDGDLIELGEVMLRFRG